MIEKLNILEHIRKRPGMYIGALNHYGYQELLSYLIEDFIKAGIYEMTFLLKKNNQLIIEGSCTKTFLPVLDALKHLHDYKNEKFYLSLAGIVALSKYTRIEINGVHAFRSEKGNPEFLEDVQNADSNRIKIEFIPDKEIFQDVILNYDLLNNLLRRFSFLNSQLKIKCIDQSKTEKQINIFHYPKGLSEIIDYELEKSFSYYSSVFKLNFEKKTEFSYSLALAFVSSYWVKPKLKIYANYKETVLGGSLLDGILQGLKKFLNEESSKRNLKLSIRNVKLQKHLCLYASVRGELAYLGATRCKLGTPKVQTEIKEFVYQELKLYFADKESQVSGILDILMEDI
ncbi:hypothetical protein [Chryseobacterium carnipullorum]|uniref:hypothetical protein n=1 Tax=Chryseobacterium carnipullorum TaxID=1124835 RepID=UPI000E893BCB|nr:hypothetical protein [Chryseobacterium carnipullorum]HBV18019.1 hypothetical protein [Chryseobacterium carnipullorum]